MALWDVFGGRSEVEDAPATKVEQVAAMLQAKAQRDREDLEDKQEALKAKAEASAREADVKARAAAQFGHG